VHALATIRGGGECGEEWHRAGMLEKKQNGYDDFFAAAERLIAERGTTAACLGIYGHSNGGLLVGAVLVQRPDLFGAAVANAGHYDMLRYPKFTVGAAESRSSALPTTRQRSARSARIRRSTT